MFALLTNYSLLYKLTDAYEEDIKGKEVIVSSKVTPPVKSTLTEEEVRVMDAYKDSLYKIGKIIDWFKVNIR